MHCLTNESWDILLILAIDPAQNQSDLDKLLVLYFKKYK
jgi:hypothetical protein